MPAILSTLISGFTVLVSFFRKWFPFLNSMSTFFNIHALVKIAKFTAVAAYVTIAVGLVVGFVVLALSGFGMLYSFTSQFFTMFSSYSDSSLSNLYYVLRVFGFTDAFNTCYPYFVTAFTFFAGVNAAKIAVKGYHLVISLIAKAL